MMNPKFKLFFSNWRTKDIATAENKILKTAEQMRDYLNLNNVFTINLDLVDKKSQQFEKFDSLGARSYGALLCAISAIHDYRDELSDPTSPEAATLESLLKTMQAIYHNPRSESQKNFAALLEGAEGLLKVDKFSNLEKALELYKSLYFLLKIGNISLTKYPKFLIPKFIEASVITDLTTRAHEKTVKIFNALSEENATSAMVPQKTISQVCYAKLQSCFNDNAPIKTQITALKDNLQDIQSKTEDLLEKKQAKKRIEEEIEAVSELLTAVQENEQKILGRLYFVDLIKQHAKGYKFLAESASGKNLIEKAAALTEQNTLETFYSSLQYGVSWLTIAPTWLYRAITPYQYQEQLADYFATQESDCKKALKQHAQNHLHLLNNQLIEATQAIQNSATELAESDPKRLKTILEAPDAEIESLVKEAQVITTALTDYESLVTKAQSIQAKLDSLQSLDENVQQFIKNHDNFVVKISNFLSKFSLFFQTKAAAMVNQTYKIQQQLLVEKSTYNNLLVEGYKQFGNHPEAKEIRALLKSRIETNGNSEPRILPASNSEKVKAVTAFNHIRTTFNGLQKHSKDESLEDSESKEQKLL